MSEPLRIRELKNLIVTVVTDNSYDALRPNSAIGKSFRAGPDLSMHAECGFSLYIRTLTEDGKTGSMMFDYGQDGEGIIKNMATLGIEMAEINTL
jgi:metal-dependent hydrolase (beta-lactamase superfamily II)